MGRQFVNASDDHLTLASSNFGAAPFTISCWFESNDIATGYNLYSEANSADTTNFYQMLARGDVANDPISARAFNAGANGEALSSILRADLQAYWKFNDNGLDSSGNSRNLTYFGTEAYDTGKFGSGYDIPGVVGNRAEADDASVLRFSGASATFSISVWVNPTTLATGGTLSTIVGKLSTNALQGWEVSILNDGSITWVGDGQQFVTTSPGDIVTGIFQHIMVVSDGTRIKGYIANTEVFDIAYADALSTTTTLSIADRNTGPAPDFAYDGVYDELALWNRALTASERSFLFNNGLGVEIEDDSTGFVANTWTHIAAIEASTASRIVYKDGGSKGINTTTVTTPSGLNTTQIGRFGGSTGPSPLDGTMGPISGWPSVLSDAQTASLGVGRNPLTLQTLPTMHLPMTGGIQNMISGGAAFTNSGTTEAGHKPMGW